MSFRDVICDEAHTLRNPNLKSVSKRNADRRKAKKYRVPAGLLQVSARIARERAAIAAQKKEQRAEAEAEASREAEKPSSPPLPSSGAR